MTAVQIGSGGTISPAPLPWIPPELALRPLILRPVERLVVEASPWTPDVGEAAGRAPNRANTSLTLVGNSADSRGLAQCRATVCGTPPNDNAHLPGPLGEQHVMERLHAAPVRCSDWFGSARALASALLLAPIRKRFHDDPAFGL
jgi:hypothetical protein